MDVIESTLQERGSRYGTLTGNGTISQKLKDVVRDDAGWGKLGVDQKEAIDNIFQKLARAISGDPNYADNWLDIEGYARLVREKIERVEKEKEFVKDELEKQTGRSVTWDILDNRARTTYGAYLRPVMVDGTLGPYVEKDSSILDSLCVVQLRHATIYIGLDGTTYVESD